MKYNPVYKGGRCWNGFHLDAGKVVHAIFSDEPHGYWGGKAICGTEPGLRSYGWALAKDYFSREDIRPAKVTCEKCLKKLSKEEING